MNRSPMVASLWGTEAQAMANDEMVAPETRWVRDYRLCLSLVSVSTAIAWYVMR